MDDPCYLTIYFHFQSDLRLLINFTTDLNNPNSPQFKSLANAIKATLLPPLKEALPGVVDVNVYAFKEGSVIAEYNIVMDPDAAAVNASRIQSAITRVVSGGNLKELNVDTTFMPHVKGEDNKICSGVFFNLFDWSPL